jgi:hypothetical protein
MSESTDQVLAQISMDEQRLNAALGEIDSRFMALDSQRRELRRERFGYVLARRFGPIVTQVDVWPLYAIYVLLILGPSSLLAFGILRAIWFPTWLAGVGAAVVALMAGYYGWKLKDVEREIRRRYPDQPSQNIQRLQSEIETLDLQVKPITQERRSVQRQLVDLSAKSSQLKQQMADEKEKQRQADQLQREREAQEKKQAKLQLLNGRWETLRGIPFEEFLAKVLRQHGYEVELTPASGDQGVDLVAVIFGQRVAIQAKGYSNMVGNESVQQVVAGKRFYNCTHAAVITTAVSRMLPWRWRKATTA